MRLQLSAGGAFAVALVAAAPAPAVAQTPESGLRARTMVYQDDDYTTVVTSAAEASAALGDTGAIRGGYLVDVTSSASIDVVTAATDRWSERRDEVRAGADLYVDTAIFSVDWVRSIEPDWDSHRITGGGAIELAQRATTLSLGGGVILNDVGRAGEQGSGGAFEESQTAYVANARWVQVLDPESFLAVGYAGQYVTGYQASPYRYVLVGAGTVVPERHPRERLRHAVVGQYRLALSPAVSFGIDERLYYDSWQVFGSTTVLTVGFELSRAVDLELENRFHYQRAASFYQDRYEEPRAFVTQDRELATFVDDYFGPSLVVTGRDVGPLSRVRLDVSLQGFVYRFFDFSELPTRIGFVAGAGIGGTFR